MASETRGDQVEVTFENETMDNVDPKRLGSLQVLEFYNKMKKSVVLIEVAAPGLDNAIEEKYMHSTGCNTKSVHFRRVDETVFYEAKLVHRNDGNDLAILRPFQALEDVNYVKFAEDYSATVGMDIYSISHVQDFVYTFSAGQVAYPSLKPLRDNDPDNKLAFYSRTPNSRIASDIINEKDKELKTYRPNLEFLQLNNLHGGTGSSGSPIFNSQGLVVGLEVFVLGGFDFAVPVNELKKFIDSGRRKMIFMGGEKKESADEHQTLKKKAKVTYLKN